MISMKFPSALKAKVANSERAFYKEGKRLEMMSELQIKKKLMEKNMALTTIRQNELRRSMEFERERQEIALKNDLRLQFVNSFRITNRMSILKNNPSLAEQLHSFVSLPVVGEIPVVEPIPPPATELIPEKPKRFDPYHDTSMFSKALPSTSPRLACKKCDHTIARDPRGVHLFYWNNSHHLSLQEELCDTLTYSNSFTVKPHEIGWKQAKITCPCCDNFIGSVGLVHNRVKTLLKGTMVAWRSGRILPENFERWKDEENRGRDRIGLSLSANSLFVSFSLKTHSKRFILDTKEMEKLFKENGKKIDPTFLKMDTTDQTLGGVVTTTPWSERKKEKNKEGSEKPLEKTARDLAQLADALEEIVSCDVSEVESVLSEWKRLFATKTVNEVAHKLHTGVYSRMARAATALDSSATIRSLVEADLELYLTRQPKQLKGLSARSVSDLMLVAAKLGVENASRFFDCAITELAQRHKEMGPYAVAFGRSSENVRSARKILEGQIPAESEKKIPQALVNHPTPSSRFDLPLQENGEHDLLCLECENRAVYSPRRGEQVGVRHGSIPVVCKRHAPESYVKCDVDFPKPFFKERRGDKLDWRISKVPDLHKPYESPADHLRIPLARDKIFTVFTDTDFAHLERELTQHLDWADKLFHEEKLPSLQAAVGIDVEWRPQFWYNPNANVASIAQIATREKVFIVDVIALGKKLAPLFQRLFLSPSVAKVGHGLAEDLTRIARMVDSAQENSFASFFPVQSVVELAPLYAAASGVAIGPRTQPSLVKMVENATKLKLDKTCQMTDWERRPLSEAQIAYAANDAHVSFVLLDTFAQRIAERESKFELSRFLSAQGAGHKIQDGGFSDKERRIFLLRKRKKEDSAVSQAGSARALTNAEVQESKKNETFAILRSKEPDTENSIALKSYLNEKGIQIDPDATPGALEIASQFLKENLKKVVKDHFT